MSCIACSAPEMEWHDDGGVQTADCRECDSPLCSACAGLFEAEGGYGEDGSGVRVTAWCVPCYTARQARRAS